MLAEKPHNLKIAASLQSCSIILNFRFFVLCGNVQKTWNLSFIRKLGYPKKEQISRYSSDITIVQELCFFLVSVYFLPKERSSVVSNDRLTK